MEKVEISVRVNAAVRNAVEGYCRLRGVAMNHFVQEALLDRLEEIQDIEDLKTMPHEPTRPLADSLREIRWQ